MKGVIGERKILFDDVMTLAQDHLSVKVPRTGFAGINISSHNLCAAQLGENAGFDRALKIEREIVINLSHAFDRADDFSRSRRTKEVLAPAPGIHGMDVVHYRLLWADGMGIGFASLRRKQLRPALLDKPANGGVGQGDTDCGGCRQGMQNVAHGAEPHNQDFYHGRLNNSVVEWSLGSPTMATRPPQATTTSRSGTLS